MPLSLEQFKELRSKGLSTEQIVSFEKGGKPQQNENNQQVESQPQKRFNLKSEQPYDSYSYGDALADTGKTVVNSLANVGDSVTQPIIHPLKTLGALLSGAGQAITHPIDTAKGIGESITSTDNPDKVPNWAYSIHNDPLGFAGNVVAAGGAVKALPMLSKGATNILKPLLKYQNTMQLAEKAKAGLDSVRTTLGQAKELALADVKDIPAEINWGGNVSQKVVNAIKNPVYEVEFTPEGGVVQNIGNLDKIKTAMSDMLSTKDFIEAGNIEKKQILKFGGKIRDSMVKAANDAGKPELGKSLKNYHDFMEKYNPINDHITDKYDKAESDKLKSTFKLFKNGEVKKAWRDVISANPELQGSKDLKNVISIMNRNELLKGLLGTATIGELGKKTITGHF